LIDLGDWIAESTVTAIMLFERIAVVSPIAKKNEENQVVAVMGDGACT
jgi:hypothetical protein